MFAMRLPHTTALPARQSWNTPIPSTQRLCTTRKIEAFCYLSGKDAIFSRYASLDEDKEFFLPSRNIIFTRTAMHHATKPSNTISLLLNREGETLEFETDLIPVIVSQEGVEELEKLHQECDGIYEQISKLQEKQYQLQEKIERIFSELCSQAPLPPKEFD